MVSIVGTGLSDKVLRADLHVRHVVFLAKVVAVNAAIIQITKG
jgi:hypothetical protein